MKHLVYLPCYMPLHDAWRAAHLRAINIKETRVAINSCYRPEVGGDSRYFLRYLWTWEHENMRAGSMPACVYGSGDSWATVKQQNPWKAYGSSFKRFMRNTYATCKHSTLMHTTLGRMARCTHSLQHAPARTFLYGSGESHWECCMSYAPWYVICLRLCF